MSQTAAASGNDDPFSNMRLLLFKVPYMGTPYESIRCPYYVILMHTHSALKGGGLGTFSHVTKVLKRFKTFIT
jgi:hypothetical protein